MAIDKYINTSHSPLRHTVMSARMKEMQMNVDRVLSQYHVNSRGWYLSLHSQGSGVDTQPFYLLDYNTQRLNLITVYSRRRTGSTRLLCGAGIGVTVRIRIGFQRVH